MLNLGSAASSPQRNMHWIAWVDQAGARFFWCGRAVGYPVPCVLRARFCDPTSHTLKEPDQRNQRESELTSTLRPHGLSAPPKEIAVSSSPSLKKLGPTHLYAGPSAYARGFRGLWPKQKATPYPRRMSLHGRTPCALHQKPYLLYLVLPTSSIHLACALNAMRSQHNVRATKRFERQRQKDSSK